MRLILIDSRLALLAIRAGWPAVRLARALKEGWVLVELTSGVTLPPGEKLWCSYGTIALMIPLREASGGNP